MLSAVNGEKAAVASELEQLLVQVTAGNAAAYDKLAAAVQGRLRQMAERRLNRAFGPNHPGVTIQPTALADDTFMKLIKYRQRYDSAGHFFAIASQEMRRVLLDYCRQRKAQKRGGGALRVSLDPEAHPAPQSPDVDFEALDEVLERLSRHENGRQANVVRYRVYWGLTIAETAKALGVSHATVERDWAFAKAWLAAELAEGE